MAKNRDIIKVKKSTYKYVAQMLRGGITTIYSACILGKSKSFDTEREAAIYVDKVLILAGKKPVNILKKV